MLLGVSHSFRHGQHFGEPHTENDPRDACGKLVKLDPRFRNDFSKVSTVQADYPIFRLVG
jgi:hypothetical protein